MWDLDLAVCYVSRVILCWTITSWIIQLPIFPLTNIFSQHTLHLFLSFHSTNFISKHATKSILFLKEDLVYHDLFFISQKFADCLAQAIYAAFCESFPMSFKLFDDDFRNDLLNTLSEWITGKFVNSSTKAYIFMFKTVYFNPKTSSDFMYRQLKIATHKTIERRAVFWWFPKLS